MNKLIRPGWWQRWKLTLNLPRSLWLTWKLIQDKQVAGRLKIMYLGLGLGYLLFPFDLVVDALPVAGQVDDLAVLIFLLNRFLASVPPDILRKYQT